nr:hypothetical protein [Sicyoidochytrium minutum DNA virus]
MVERKPSLYERALDVIHDGEQVTVYLGGKREVTMILEGILFSGNDDIDVKLVEERNNVSIPGKDWIIQFRDGKAEGFQLYVGMREHARASVYVLGPTKARNSLIDRLLKPRFKMYVSIAAAGLDWDGPLD